MSEHSPASGQPLWHGRFGEGPADELLAFTVSLPFDRRLAADDLTGSHAHVQMLARVGLLTDSELRAAERRLGQEAAALQLARDTAITPSQAAGALTESRTSLSESERIAVVAKRPSVSLRDLFRATGVGNDIPAEAVMSAEIEIKYDGYLAREREAAARLAELASFVLPPDLPYLELRTLATEARQKLDRVRPGSLAQAARVPGVTPSDLHNLVLEATRWRRRVA